jgi:hypothetical protein
MNKNVCWYFDNHMCEHIIKYINFNNILKFFLVQEGYLLKILVTTSMSLQKNIQAFIPLKNFINEQECLLLF